MSRNNGELPDRKYYNVAIGNNENSNQRSYASYKNVLNQQLISDPSKYYLAVLRFQIPTANIPIFIPEIESLGPNNPTGDVNKTVYTVTLTYTIGLTTYTSGTVNVIYIGNTNESTPRPITPENPNPMINPSTYYFIYNYRRFIDFVNTAYQTAYDNLNNALILAAQPPLTSGPPFITYNGTNYLMSIHCPAISLQPSGGMRIYMNYKLFTFFDGVEFYFLDNLADLGVEIITKNYNGTNFDGTYYIMSQQYPTLSVWNVFKSIQIVSSMLPVENEVVPIPSYQNQNVINTLSVVKDFVPFYENGPEYRTFINFRYNGAYELIDLNSNVPISTIDISVFWLDRYGNRYLVSIPYNQILTIKFVFIKKSTFTG